MAATAPKVSSGMAVSAGATNPAVSVAVARARAAKASRAILSAARFTAGQNEVVPGRVNLCRSAPAATPRAARNTRVSGSASAASPAASRPTAGAAAANPATLATRSDDTACQSRNSAVHTVSVTPQNRRPSASPKPNRLFSRNAQASRSTSTTARAPMPSAVLTRPLRRSSPAVASMARVKSPTMAERTARPATTKATVRNTIAATETRVTPTSSSTTCTLERLCGAGPVGVAVAGLLGGAGGV